MALKISVRTVLPAREPGDIVVVGMPEGEHRSNKKDSPLSGFDRALGGALSRLIKREDFQGKKDTQIALSTIGRLKADRLVVLGLGKLDDLGIGDIRIFAARGARAANAYNAKRLVLGVPAGLESRLREVVEGVELGAYRFTKYFTGDRKPKAELEHVSICLTGKTPADAKDVIATAQAVAQGVNLSRDLSNEPPNVLYPEILADAARRVAKDVGLKILVFDFKEIQRRGMRLLQAVGQGSERKPCLVHMSWTPPGTSKDRKRLVFVGKGITFDTGGISIKPAASMGEMKHDMSGAANVIGLMASVGRLKPDVEVHGIFAAAENMPDAGAYRPGDVWPSLDGKTVEITNTDAEGRLVLADALAYARDLDPDLMVDNATLTGACVVGLGNACSAWYASNEETAQQFASAAKASGELMWRLPLIEELKDQLKSDHADLKNAGDRMGGSISAALFLREFIGKARNWVHCDIAGPAMGDRIRGWDPKGGTGHGMLTFIELVERAAKSSAKALPAGTTNGTKAAHGVGPKPAKRKARTAARR
jgi:leucyl aminopeptidase